MADENVEIIKTIQAEAKKRDTGVETEHELSEEFKELAKMKRATFDIPYTDVDPLR